MAGAARHGRVGEPGRRAAARRWHHTRCGDALPVAPVPAAPARVAPPPRIPVPGRRPRPGRWAGRGRDRGRHRATDRRGRRPQPGDVRSSVEPGRLQHRADRLLPAVGGAGRTAGRGGVPDAGGRPRGRRRAGLPEDPGARSARSGAVQPARRRGAGRHGAVGGAALLLSFPAHRRDHRGGDHGFRARPARLRSLRRAHPSPLRARRDPVGDPGHRGRLAVRAGTRDPARAPAAGRGPGAGRGPRQLGRDAAARRAPDRRRAARRRVRGAGRRVPGHRGRGARRARRCAGRRGGVPMARHAR